MVEEQVIMGAQKFEAQAAKWENGRTPEDGPPDRIDTASFWMENGEVVTDPNRLAELEAKIQEESKWDSSQPYKTPLQHI